MHKRAVLITGTGWIATALGERLEKQGYEVRFLSTSKKGQPYYYWDPIRGKMDTQVLENVSVVFHLAGAGIAEKRWTPRRKQVIQASRVKSAELLLQALKEKKQRIAQFVSASAIGAYGAVLSDTIFTEEDAYAEDFLGQTCRLWEGMALRFQEEEVADVVSIHRFGVVLGRGGGALTKLLAPFRWKMALILGSGKQWLPWVSLNDVCRQLLFAMDQSLNGIYNCVVDPESQVTFYEFIEVAYKLFHPWIRIRIPETILELALGEMGKVVTLGSRVANAKIKGTGFHYVDTDLREVLTQISRSMRMVLV